MRTRILTLLLISAAAATTVLAQDIDLAGRNERWKQFNKNNFHTLDFSKYRLTPARLAKLTNEEYVDDLSLLRGVVFGKRGRIFKERSIQDYLEKQPWYKPNAKFTNALLSRGERTNLDLIRLTEAERHTFVEPGDMRIWQAREITDDNLRTYSGAELTILASEVEAIHGKTFTEEWLQKYFSERYWYKPNPAYSGSVLTDVERKNIEKLWAEREKGRNTAISIGDMDNFQTVLLTEDKLKNLTILELRILREEFYARRGKKFDVPGIRQYFDWRDWYKPAKNQKTVKLSMIEKENVDILAARENVLREWIATTAIGDDYLGDLFAEDLRVLRNEIYARHGRVFKDADLQKYFAAQPWYKPDPTFTDEKLSEIEIANLAKIKEAEESAASKFSEAEG